LLKNSNTLFKYSFETRQVQQSFPFITLLMARVVETLQMEIGQVDIGQIQFDSKSRDDIPRVLRGLQYIYVHRPIREKIFEVLENDIAPHVDKKNGRPGLALWKILVLGVLRLDLNCDYDRLHELANKHETVRQMLGHADFFDKHYYNLQTIKDNVSLLTPKLLEKINQIVVDAGHLLLKKKRKLTPAWAVRLLCS